MADTPEDTAPSHTWRSTVSETVTEYVDGFKNEVKAARTSLSGKTWRDLAGVAARA